MRLMFTYVKIWPTLAKYSCRRWIFDVQSATKGMKGLPRATYNVFVLWSLLKQVLCNSSFLLYWETDFLNCTWSCKHSFWLYFVTYYFAVFGVHQIPCNQRLFEGLIIAVGCRAPCQRTQMLQMWQLMPCTVQWTMHRSFQLLRQLLRTDIYLHHTVSLTEINLYTSFLVEDKVRFWLP
jgi:hypothetical protein